MLTQSARPAFAAAWCVLLAAACTTRGPEPVPPPQTPVPRVLHGRPGILTTHPVPAGSRAFEIDSKKSVVTILVYRAGPLAMFGHNHVVTSSRITGVAWVGSDLAGSGFEIHVPAAGLVVDDPAARAAAGGDFDGEVPASAREATYRNMTRTEVLDVAEYPEIIVRSAGLAGSWERPMAHADLTIRGETRRVEIPLEIQRSADTLAARGSLQIRQTDFGITPFSVGGGAMQVGDELDVSFAIAAVPR